MSKCQAGHDEHLDKTDCSIIPWVRQGLMTCGSTPQTHLGTEQPPPALLTHPSALRGLPGSLSSLCICHLMKHAGS